MSHLKERTEKNCLNCNAQVENRFCSVCGQENIEPKETVWHLISHFFEDITHFDGKFFSSTRLLLTRPGFLSYEYMVGRRASYLNPIRMYVFTSAIFFLIFFSFYKKADENIPEKKDNATTYLKKLKEGRNELKESFGDISDPNAKTMVLKKMASIENEIAILTKDSTQLDSLKNLHNNTTFITLKDDSKEKYQTLKEYDSVQKQLPENKRDNFFERKVERRNLFLKEKYHGDRKEIFEGIKENFLHHFPQMLFISLPIFALILQMLYFRRKNFYYVNHAIFSIHLYIATFLFILIGLWTGSIFGWFHLKVPGFIKFIINFGTLFYWYKAMRNFYHQSRLKTIFKMGLLVSIFSIILILIFVLFLLFLIFTI